MSHESSYRSAHLDVPRLLPASVSFSPRYQFLDYKSHSSRWPSTRTSNSFGDDQMRSCSGVSEPPSSSRKTQMGLPYYTKYLEGKITLMEEQHKKVFAENINLSNQLTRAEERIRELDEKTGSLEESLLRIKSGREPHLSSRECFAQEESTTQTGDSTLSDAATTTESPRRFDCAVQTKLEQKQESNNPAREDFISINKGDLAVLESEMKSLRDAVRSKEELWDGAVERERNYREHLARLSFELITLRQLADTRTNEIQTLSHKLTDTERELRETQRELKRTTIKLHKFQKTSDEVGAQEVKTVGIGDSSDRRTEAMPARSGKPKSGTTRAAFSPRAAGGCSPRE